MNIQSKKIKFLYEKNSHFNLANLLTFANITFGLIAIFFITHDDFFFAALFAWIGGAFDIFDGKIARKHGLSTEFGVQLDSFADSLSFVLVPVLFIFFAIFDKSAWFSVLVAGIVLIYYFISGIRRLISFNLQSSAGEVSKHFTGIPTPLGAIILWIYYLLWYFGVLHSELIILTLIIITGYLLNSKLKIPHP